jgi:hypothetical protein
MFMHCVYEKFVNFMRGEIFRLSKKYPLNRKTYTHPSIGRPWCIWQFQRSSLVKGVESSGESGYLLLLNSDWEVSYRGNGQAPFV